MKERDILASPPIVAIPLVAIAYLFSPGGGSLSLSGWVLVIFFFIVMTLLYFWAVAQEAQKWVIPFQFVAQGALLTSVSMQFGGVYLSWIGLLLFLIGLTLVVSISFFGSSDSFDTTNVNIVRQVDEIFEKFPFPAFMANFNGGIISASEGLIRLLGKSREEILSLNANNIIPTDGNIGGKKWKLSKQENQGNNWYILNEEKGGAGAPSPANAAPLVDSETNLFSSAYAKLRATDEMARIKRYKRWGVFVLVEFGFVYSMGNSPMSDDAKQKMFFRSYCAFMKSALRNCDISWRIGEFTALVFLPETVGGESVTQVTDKISSFEKPLADIIGGIQGEIKMRVGNIFFNASTRDMTYDELIGALNESAENKNYK